MLVGDSHVAESDYERIEAEYKSLEGQREQKREAFIDRLARGEL